MKKISILAILFICINAHLTKAQVGEHRNDFAIGVNIGCALNQMTFDPSIKQTWKTGMTAGLTFRYTCEKYFKSLCAVQAELNYANLGWKEVIETSSDTYERDIHYIQMPILARMGWGHEKKGMMAYIVLGPQIGYALSENSKQSGEFSDFTLSLRPGQVHEQYSMPIENKFDYGITGGLGTEYNSSIGHFQLEGRYYFALSDIFGNGKKDVFGRSAHGTITIKAAYLFDLVRTK